LLNLVVKSTFYLGSLYFVGRLFHTSMPLLARVCLVYSFCVAMKNFLCYDYEFANLSKNSLWIILVDSVDENTGTWIYSLNNNLFYINWVFVSH
jgi:hypothetical protein